MGGQEYIETGFGARASGQVPNAHLERVSSQADSLEDLVYRLLLANEAMWTLCAERLGLTQDDLLTRMRELDASDGRIDGRHTQDPAARRCPSCNAVVPNEMTACQFCGTAAPAGANPFVQ
jgi:hypothetical protein